MTEEKTPFYQKPLQVAIITVILTTISPLFLDFFKGIKIVSTFTIIFSWLGWLLEYPVKLYWFIPTIAIILVIAIYRDVKNRRKISKIREVAIQMSKLHEEMSDDYQKRLKFEQDKNINTPIKLVNKPIDIFQLDKILSYKGETINGLTWKWNWRKNPITDAYEPLDARPVCDVGKCNYKELYTDNVESMYGYRTFSCPLCRKNYNALPSIAKINETIKNLALTNKHKWNS